MLNALFDEVSAKKSLPLLCTRLSEEKFRALKPAHAKNMDYDRLSQTAFVGGTLPEIDSVSAAVVTAGTGDLTVATESARTLEYLGVPRRIFADIGVAGLWRLEARIDEINQSDVVIVVAGMDAALASVLGGLTPRPVIAVPSSVGYGVASGGMTALNSILASCSPGICVMNIDNGYGAACAAYRIIHQLRLSQKK